ncbi:MAG: hypothetical protein NVSMB2_12550 [Chloroflexota bacterium]
MGVELELLGPKATFRRRRSLAAGRAAARRALADLGASAAQEGIGRGRGGEPLWPSDMVGTITHTEDVAMAVVGWRRDCAGLGIDLEALAPGMSERAARLVCTPTERAWLVDRSGEWRTRIFSAKEAVFKALNPLEGVYLGFADAELLWHEADGAFDARLLKPTAAGFDRGAVVRVRSTVVGTLILSVTFAPATTLSWEASARRAE